MKKKKKRHLKKGVKFFILSILVFSLYQVYPRFKQWFLPLTESSQDIENTNDLEKTIERLNKNETLSTLDKLKELNSFDTRLTEIIENYDLYPEELLETLARDLDLLDFVLDYPQKEGHVYSDTVGNVDKNTIPLLLQWDERWGYGSYGNSSVAISGCGPTALSMVLIGLTHDTTITPYKIAKFSQEHGYYLNDTGTSWDLMTTGAEQLGVKSKELPLSKTKIFQVLQNGHYIICSMRKGDFTTKGHFIVLVGIEDGKIKIHDPNSKKRSNKLWEYDTLQTQIKNLWEFYI